MAPLARLHLARQQPALAIELIDRVLASRDFADYAEAPLRAVAVDGFVMLDMVDDAQRHCERLGALAANQPTKALKAMAAAARGRICVAIGQGDARACWHEAISLYGAARMPAEVAGARLELAKLLSSTRSEVAIAEASAAFDVLDRRAIHSADDAAGAAAHARRGGTDWSERATWS